MAEKRTRPKLSCCMHQAGMRPLSDLHTCVFFKTLEMVCFSNYACPFHLGRTCRLQHGNPTKCARQSGGGGCPPSRLAKKISPMAKRTKSSTFHASRAACAQEQGMGNMDRIEIHKRTFAYIPYTMQSTRVDLGFQRLCGHNG